MKPESLITFILGIAILVVGIIFLLSGSMGGIIPVVIGSALGCLGFRRNRASTIIFGHACIVLGCFLVTWGIYLLPTSKPIFSHIVGRPLFWGLISIFGGICANYHGFCNCVRKQK